MKHLVRLAVLGVVLLQPGAGASLPGPGTLAFVAGVSGQGHLYTIEADGTGLTNLTAAYPAAWTMGGFDWSPDGARLVYTHFDSITDSDIYTLEPGGSRHRLTSAPGREDHPVWSPDGTEVAFTSCCSNGVHHLFAMDADGGNWRPIVNEAVHGYHWSTRDEIAFTILNVSTYEIHVVKSDGTGHRVLGRGRSGRWSPSGDRIAFLAPGTGGQQTVHVANADGSGRREVSPRPANATGSWSPDGTEIAFPRIVHGCAPPPCTEIYAVEVDGGRERLLASRFPRYSAGPWAPDGLRVALHAHPEGLVVVNAEGTCHLLLRGLPSSPSGGLWKPGTGGAPFLCADLTLTGEVASPVVRRSHRLTYRFHVSNRGALPATDLQLLVELSDAFTSVSITADRGACRLSARTIRCELDRLGVGQTAAYEVVIRPRGDGPLRAAVRVSAREIDPNPDDNQLGLPTHVYDCSVLGTFGPDALTGTRRHDVICGLDGDDTVQGLAGRDNIAAGPGDDVVVAGRARDVVYAETGEDRIRTGDGPDVIRAGAGNDSIAAGHGSDVVAGGDGSDTINPAAGRDKVSGGPGNDRIVVLDRARDAVDCGAGFDIVLADAHDRVALNCESLRRRRGR